MAMPAGKISRLAIALLACVLAGACGGGAGSGEAVGPPPRAAPASIPAPSRSAAAPLRDWPEFGLNPQREDASSHATGITAANVGRLHRLRVALPGTVDSSPIYLHAASVAGGRRSVIVATTTYGRTLALDAADGRILWTFTPPGYARWAGSPQITTASPLADPDGRFVYAASPNGLIHKLALADGAEQPGWPVSVTRDATHEKLAAALNLDGPYVVAATGGYLGDAPPYQGHVVLIGRAGGRIHAIFNTLCAARRTLIVPASCRASDSAILARAGAVVEPGGSILIATGNGPWNGTTDFGDSVLELGFPGLGLRQAYTPTDQAQLDAGDTDLGSSAPVLLGGDRVVIAGKDGIVRVLARDRLDGRPPRGRRRERLGGELQRLPLPGGGELFSAPAVWRAGGRTALFIGGEHGTGAYTLSGGELRLVWENGAPGTSPVLAGGLLYVYDPQEGGIAVYDPRSPRPLAKLAGTPGHWNSPIVVDGHVVEPEGDANDHSLTGALDLFSVS